MRRHSIAALLAGLAGCGSGCDGERLKPPETPHTAGSNDAQPGTASGSDTTMPGSQPGVLDAAPGTLDSLHAALAAAERGDPTGRVVLEFFGDSHTAGDSMTGRVRRQLQAQFGDGGRGLVAAGRPAARHYYQRDVRYGASGRWKAAVGGVRDPEPFGMAGLRVYGERKGAQLWVETCADCPTGTSVAQFEIFYQAAPDHGILRYRVDDTPWQQVATKTATIEPPHPARQVIVVPDGPHKLTIEHGGGGVLDLYGVALERKRPGVIVDSLGVVGRRLGSLRSWDWSIIGEQLATRDPRLVVLQYGTNEADDPDLDLEAFAKYYDETILRIRAAAPLASILILGPPDMGTREAGKSCDRPKKKPKRRDRNAADVPIEEPVIPECEWRTPGILREIIAVEHAAALRNKVAFFDTFAAMGGGDRMHGWVTGEPKIAYRDHVHLNDAGYQIWADALLGAVLADHDRWRRASNVPAPAATDPPGSPRARAP